VDKLAFMMREEKVKLNNKGEVGDEIIIAVICIVCISVIIGLMFALPAWNVWRSGLSGEADLKKASQTRQIQIEQARGEKEAAVLRAEAIKIVGKATKDFPEYRQQEFIGGFAEALKEGKISQVIYVPTEAMIPIMEAGRGQK
jgi:hypothetical protein